MMNVELDWFEKHATKRPYVWGKAPYPIPFPIPFRFPENDNGCPRPKDCRMPATFAAFRERERERERARPL